MLSKNLAFHWIVAHAWLIQLKTIWFTWNHEFLLRKLGGLMNIANGLIEIGCMMHLTQWSGSFCVSFWFYLLRKFESGGTSLPVRFFLYIRKTKQDNNMTHCIGLVYAETQIELSRPIWLNVVCHENKTGTQT